MLSSLQTNREKRMVCPRSLQQLLLLVCALERCSAVDLCSFAGSDRNGNSVASGSLCDGSYTGTSLCATRRLAPYSPARPLSLTRVERAGGHPTPLAPSRAPRLPCRCSRLVLFLRTGTSTRIRSVA